MATGFENWSKMHSEVKVLESERGRKFVRIQNVEGGEIESVSIFFEDGDEIHLPLVFTGLSAKAKQTSGE